MSSACMYIYIDFINMNCNFKAFCVILSILVKYNIVYNLYSFCPIPYYAAPRL